MSANTASMPRISAAPGTAGYDNWKVGVTLEEEPSSSDDEPPIVTAEVDASGSTLIN